MVLEDGRPPRRRTRRARRWSPPTFEQIRHRGEARVSGQLHRQLIEPPVRLLPAEDPPRPTPPSDARGNDGRGRLAVTEDEDLLSAMFRLIHYLREVGLHVGKR